MCLCTGAACASTGRGALPTSQMALPTLLAGEHTRLVCQSLRCVCAHTAEVCEPSSPVFKPSKFVCVPAAGVGAPAGGVCAPDSQEVRSTAPFASTERQGTSILGPKMHLVRFSLAVNSVSEQFPWLASETDGCRSGRTGSPGKRVYPIRVPRVRIPPHPPVFQSPSRLKGIRCLLISQATAWEREAPSELPLPLNIHKPLWMPKPKGSSDGASRSHGAWRSHFVSYIEF